MQQPPAQQQPPATQQPAIMAAPSQAHAAPVPESAVHSQALDHLGAPSTEPSFTQHFLEASAASQATEPSDASSTAAATHSGGPSASSPDDLTEQALDLHTEPASGACCAEASAAGPPLEQSSPLPGMATLNQGLADTISCTSMPKASADGPQPGASCPRDHLFSPSSQQASSAASTSSAPGLAETVLQSERTPGLQSSSASQLVPVRGGPDPPEALGKLAREGGGAVQIALTLMQCWADVMAAHLRHESPPKPPTDSPAAAGKPSAASVKLPSPLVSQSAKAETGSVAAATSPADPSHVSSTSLVGSIQPPRGSYDTLTGLVASPDSSPRSPPRMSPLDPAATGQLDVPRRAASNQPSHPPNFSDVSASSPAQSNTPGDGEPALLQLLQQLQVGLSACNQDIVDSSMTHQSSPEQLQANRAAHADGTEGDTYALHSRSSDAGAMGTNPLQPAGCGMAVGTHSHHQTRIAWRLLVGFQAFATGHYGQAHHAWQQASGSPAGGPLDMTDISTIHSLAGHAVKNLAWVLHPCKASGGSAPSPSQRVSPAHGLANRRASVIDDNSVMDHASGHASGSTVPALQPAVSILPSISLEDFPAGPSQSAGGGVENTSSPAAVHTPSAAPLSKILPQADPIPGCESTSGQAPAADQQNKIRGSGLPEPGRDDGEVSMSHAASMTGGGPLHRLVSQAGNLGHASPDETSTPSRPLSDSPTQPARSTKPPAIKQAWAHSKFGDPGEGDEVMGSGSGLSALEWIAEHAIGPMHPEWWMPAPGTALAQACRDVAERLSAGAGALGAACLVVWKKLFLTFNLCRLEGTGSAAGACGCNLIVVGVLGKKHARQCGSDCNRDQCCCHFEGKHRQGTGRWGMGVTLISRWKSCTPSRLH